MTDVDGMTPPASDVATSDEVAESLSTVGYAMFAFLNNGPLEGIPSMTAFMAQVRIDEENARRAAEAAAQAAEQAAALAAAQANQPPAIGYLPDEDAGFSQTTVGEDMGAVRPSINVPVPSGASSVQIPAGPTDPNSPAEVEPEKKEAHPQPKDPVGVIPEYKGNTTLAMLNEISFLDE